jgi:hypothetical protein
MMPHLRTLVGGGGLAGASILGSISPSAASAPCLSFPCSAPTATTKVTCRLAGVEFFPHERVSIVYTVTSRTAAGRDRVTVVRRTALTDDSGAVRRSSFSCRVDPKVLAYIASVTVSGMQHDRATITTAGTP